jgi:predicted transglutaminase-like cysteine proteinase
MSKGFLAFVVAAAMVALAGPVVAQDVDFTNVAYAQVSKQTSIPVGHADFCKHYPGDCQPHAQVIEAMTLTDARWQELVSINGHYNASITPVTDQDYYNVAELWAYPTDGYGDCEDFALAKRHALIAAGWPASALLMTVVRESNGNGHAVLMVRTDRGDLVLDNQEALIKVWTDTPYTYLKRQSQADAGRWVDITDTRMVRVAGR